MTGPVLLGVAGVAGLLVAGHRARQAAGARSRLGRRAPVPVRSPTGVEVRLGPALAAAEVPWTTGVVVRGWAGGVVGTAAGAGLVAGPRAALLVAVAAALGPALVLWSRRDLQARRLDRDLPLVLDEVARALRGGCSLAQAIAAAGGAVPGPAGAAAAGLAEDITAGAPVADAVDAWVVRSPSPVVQLAAVALALAAEAGGTSARAVDGVAASLRERAEAADEAHALAAQARLSAVVIGAAPLVFAALAVATDPRTATFLVGSPVGLVCLAAGVALDLAALAWMRRIAASVT